MAEPLEIPSRWATLSPVERGAQLAAQGFGALARRDMLLRGITDAHIHGWIRCLRLHRRYPGVFTWGRADVPVKGELAAGLLHAGPGAALASLTLLWWRKLLNGRPNLIHIDAPGFAASRDDLAIRHPAPFLREWHRGLPVVPLPQALLTAADHLNHNSLRLVLARGEFEGCLSLSAVEAVLGRGKRGSVAVRAAMNAHLPQLAKCENGLEREFVLLCERFGLEIPEPNERIGRFRPDMTWWDRKLIVELNGNRAHRTPAQLQSDARKKKSLEEQGFTVMTFWRDEVFEAATSVARRVGRSFRS